MRGNRVEDFEHVFHDARPLCSRFGTSERYYLASPASSYSLKATSSPPVLHPAMTSRLPIHSTSARQPISSPMRVYAPAAESAPGCAYSSLAPRKTLDFADSSGRPDDANAGSDSCVTALIS